MEREIRDDYVTPAHPVAFSAPGNVKRYYKNRYGTQPILNTLQHINAYTQHREFHKPRVTNPFYVYRKRQQVQMDLIDVAKLKDDNNGITFLLLAIDSFTKYAWIRQLKTKSAITTENAIRSIIDDDMGDEKPESVFFDRGTEFTNRLVTKYLKDKNIKIVHPSSEKKAAIVERCNKTIQGLLYKFLSHNNTTVYFNDLDSLLETYNSRPHRTIKMSPSDAELPEKQNQVLQAHNERYMDIARKRKKNKYIVGERVLIKSLPTNRFHRGYHKSFNDEQFEIERVKTNMPIPMYILKSLNDGQTVSGGFYAEELQPIKGDVFKVEVLKRRKYRGRKQVYVKWGGYDDTHNQWINEKDLTLQN